MHQLTWADGQTPTTAQMNEQIYSNIEQFYSPPACRRVASNMSATIFQDGAAAFVIFDATGTGNGSAFSYDTTGGGMSATSNRITITVPGLYEIQAGIDLQFTANMTAFASGAIVKNSTTSIITPTLSRFALARVAANEHCGSATATVPLVAGDYLTLGATATGISFYLGRVVSGNISAQTCTFLEARWVGEHP